MHRAVEKSTALLASRWLGLTLSCCMLWLCVKGCTCQGQLPYSPKFCNPLSIHHSILTCYDSNALMTVTYIHTTSASPISVLYKWYLPAGKSYVLLQSLSLQHSSFHSTNAYVKSTICAFDDRLFQQLSGTPSSTAGDCNYTILMMAFLLFFQIQ